MTKVRNIKVLFDGKSIYEYLGFDEDDETLCMEKLEMGKEVSSCLAQYLEIQATIPD